MGCLIYTLYKSTTYEVAKTSSFKRLQLFQPTKLQFRSPSFVEDVKALWRQCDAVCFDVDSTVIMEEGLDELARFLGKGEEIASL